MRGTDVHQSGMFSYVSLESRVPQEHPLRGIKELLDEALGGMSLDFDQVYASEGCPSIPPERLVRASTLQILYFSVDGTLIESWAAVKSMRRRDGKDRPLLSRRWHLDLLCMLSADARSKISLGFRST